MDRLSNAYEPGTPVRSEHMDPPDDDMGQPTEDLEPAAEAKDDASQEKFAQPPTAGSSNQ